MRIHRLQLQNFRKFVELDLSFHPQFTLLIGDNGSGKTCVLDALAVAIGVWLVHPPDSTLSRSGRGVLASDVRLEGVERGDRVQFEEHGPALVKAIGDIGTERNIQWQRHNKGAKTPISLSSTIDSLKETDATTGALKLIADIYRRDRDGENVLCPIIAYYGAGRAWHPTSKRTDVSKSNGPARRWAAFYECLSAKIRIGDLQRWFRNELIAKGVSGYFRRGYLAVRFAVLNCIPDADDVWFDPDLDEIVLSINGVAQPFRNLSAGQQMMLGLTADIAIKAVTQNAYMMTDLGGADPGECTERSADPAIESIRGNGTADSQSNMEHRVLTQTPGVVLIDELDVHLHPLWQRRVPDDLARTFPSIQFVATSHSPQVIGELSIENIVLLRHDGRWDHPHVGTRGTLTDEILRYVMGASAQDAEASRLEHEIDKAVDDEDLSLAGAIQAIRCCHGGADIATKPSSRPNRK